MSLKIQVLNTGLADKPVFCMAVYTKISTLAEKVDFLLVLPIYMLQK